MPAPSHVAAGDQDEPTPVQRGESVTGARFRSTVLPLAWLAMSAAWAVVIIVTEYPAWPLALWIATTVGPLTAIGRR